MLLPVSIVFYVVLTHKVATATTDKKSLAGGEFENCFEFKRCTADGEEVKLARKELELLVYLVKYRGKICSREQILSRVLSDGVG